MPVIKPTCPNCGKQTELTGEFDFGAERLFTYKCGHAFAEALLAQAESVADYAPTEYSSLDGRKAAYQYQIEGVQFIERTNYNALIGDAMGLGKTIQALLALKKFRAAIADPDAKALIIVQSATTLQWLREGHEWIDNDDLAFFPIFGTKSIFPGCFKNYLVSRDSLARNGFWTKLKDLNFRIVVIDEVQGFKDGDSKRSKALVNLIRESGIKHKIMLSGTPIKNRASEYFTALNLLSPDHFPSEAAFRRRWIQPETTESGTVLYKRIYPWKLDQFREVTGKWILRREKEEVLTDLPPFRRDEQYVYVDDPEVKDSYNQELWLFDNFLNTADSVDTMNLLGYLTRLRKLIGNAKLGMLAEYAGLWLEDNPTEKLCIGIHHETVREALHAQLDLQGWKPLQLSGKDDAIAKARIVDQFYTPERRILVANILAGGVGLNLQCCNNAIVAERQWSAADEEQFECRFHRNGQTRPVTVTYFNAAGTIDEFLDAKVKEKRAIFGETVQGWDLTSDFDSLKDLANQVINNPLR